MNLLTARAVAETLGVSVETALRWTRRGELPAIRLPGGAIRYRPAAIEEWLTARELQKDLEPAGNGLGVMSSAGTGGGRGPG